MYLHVCIYIYILHIIREGCYCKGGRGPAAAARPTHSRCRCSKQAPGRCFEMMFRRCFPTTTEHAKHNTQDPETAPQHPATAAPTPTALLLEGKPLASAQLCDLCQLPGVATIDLAQGIWGRSFPKWKDFFGLDSEYGIIH